MKNAWLFIVILLTLTVSSCKKLENSTPPKTLKTNAIIVNSGEIAADGCGWLIRLNDQTEFSPVNLSADFQHDNLKVSITYTQLNTNTYCGMLANNPSIRQVKINNIQKVN
jgi:hypothetical protein